MNTIYDMIRDMKLRTICSLLSLLLLGVGEVWGAPKDASTFEKYVIKVDRTNSVTSHTNISTDTWYVVAKGNAFWNGNAITSLVTLPQPEDGKEATEYSPYMFSFSNNKNNATITCANGKYVVITRTGNWFTGYQYQLTTSNSSSQFNLATSSGVTFESKDNSGRYISASTNTASATTSATGWTLYPIIFYEKTSLSFDDVDVYAEVGINQTITAVLKDYGRNDLSKSIKYTIAAEDQDKAVVDQNTGEITPKAEGTVTVTATFEGDAQYAKSTATYKLHITSTLPTVDYKIVVNGHENGRAIIGGTEYKNGDDLAHPVLSKSDIQAKVIPNHVSEITLTEIIGNKATITVNYAQTYNWEIQIVRNTSLPVGAQINVSIVGKAYAMTSDNIQITNTLEAISTNYVRATQIDGYVYDVAVHNYSNSEPYRRITITYDIFHYTAPNPGSFIRLRNKNTGNYICSQSSTASDHLAMSQDEKTSVIYYDTDRKFLFYQQGQFITSDMCLDDIGNPGSAYSFNNDGNTEYFALLNASSKYIREKQDEGVYWAVPEDAISGDGYSYWYIEVLETLPVELKAAGHGYATLCCPTDLEIPGGINAYVATDRAAAGAGEYKISLQKITSGVIPAGTPVILYGTAGHTYYFPIVDASAAPITGLWDGLQGTYQAINKTDGDYTLQPTQGANTVGFYPWNKSIIDPFRAYIPAASASGVNAFTFGFDEETAIDQVSVQNRIIATRYYSLQGALLDKPAKGVNIVIDVYSDGSQRSRKVFK